MSFAMKTQPVMSLALAPVRRRGRGRGRSLFKPFFWAVPGGVDWSSSLSLCCKVLLVLDEWGTNILQHLQAVVHFVVIAFSRFSLTAGGKPKCFHTADLKRIRTATISIPLGATPAMTLALLGCFFLFWGAGGFRFRSQLSALSSECTKT